MAENIAYILLGGNVGNREQLLAEALDGIKQLAGQVLRISAIYETDSWGFESGEKFLNQVVKIKTNLSPHALLKQLKKIETNLGRTRQKNEGYSNRTIDLDILLYKDLILHDHDLKIPHPRMHLRKFTLIPLAEIAGLEIHPEFDLNIDELLKQCRDDLKVRIYNAKTLMAIANHEV
jgi:2-amino-4-hydroxy-6-hydroxymethyldihydropteridine diphosphokinase